jgi:integrase
MRSIRMHDARHGFATMMADSGKVEDRVLMELMGHSKISMTMDVYAHVVDKSKREAIKVVDELLKRKKPH